MADQVNSSLSKIKLFEPGSQFGEYTIVRRIGRGGQGSVFEVRDTLGLPWALKVSEQLALQDASAEMRFAREARCVAQMLDALPRDAGVLVGDHYGVWDRRFYVKMKLLQGESLAQRLRRVGQLSIYEATRIGERVAHAIGQAHALGVLHRDLKPENIFLTTDDRVIVLDWGCLQLLEAGQARTTLHGVICTPGYAPIEQYMATTALNLTAATDLYALGVMLYEALAGYHPFLNWSRAALNAPHAEPRAHGLAGRQAGASAPAGRESSAIHDADEPFGAKTERCQVSAELLAQLRTQSGHDTSVEPAGWSVLRSSALPSSTLPSSTLPSSTPHTGHALGATAATTLLTERDLRAPSFGVQSGMPFEAPAAVRSEGWLVAGETAMTRTARAAAPNSQALIPQAAALPRAVDPAARPAKRGAPRRFSLIEVLALQERTRPQPVAGVPVALSTLVDQLLAKRPDARPQNAGVVAEQLRRLLGTLSQAPEAFADSAPEQNARRLQRALLWMRLRQTSGRWMYALAGVLIAAGTGAGVFYGMTLSNAHPAVHLTAQHAVAEVSAAMPKPEPEREAMPELQPAQASPSAAASGGTESLASPDSDGETPRLARAVAASAKPKVSPTMGRRRAIVDRQEQVAASLTPSDRALGGPAVGLPSPGLPAVSPDVQSAVQSAAAPHTAAHRAAAQPTTAQPVTTSARTVKANSPQPLYTPDQPQMWVKDIKEPE